jgi:hypothetical protein
MPQLGGLTEGVDQPGGDAKRKKDKKLAYIAIGLGVVGVIIAWITLRNSSGSGVSTTSATGTTGAGSVAGYVDPSTDASYLQAILQSLATLQSSITPPASAPGATGTPGGQQAIPPAEAPLSGGQVRQGSGFWLGPGVSTPIRDTAPGSLFGQFFSWLSPQAYAAGAGSGGLYYEPSPNTFMPVTPSTHLAPGTPQYIHTGPPA